MAMPAIDGESPPVAPFGVMFEKFFAGRRRSVFPLTGARYKYAVCPNFDLCAACKSNTRPLALPYQPYHFGLLQLLVCQLFPIRYLSSH
jgi:hypothetical protein